VSETATVLVGDRSLSVRSVLRRLLEEGRGIEIVADVADGGELVRLVGEASPAAVVLDLDLPSLNGRPLVENINARVQVPIFVLAPRQSPESTRLAMGLSNLGVAAVYPKPETPDEWKVLGRGLGEAIRQVGRRPPGSRKAAAEKDDPPTISSELRYVAVGASTGGPGAVYDLLAATGPHSKVGIAVVQHIAEGFESVLTDWLALELGRDVAVARNGEHLRAGSVRIAPPGHHLSLDRGGRLHLDQLTAPVDGHRPSVEILFRSLLDQQASRVAAVLLSGMGSDGADAMAELRRANVLTIAQDEASCAVYGMPRAAVERRAAAYALAPTQIGRLLARAGE
jgi:two-component system chemotaxis response regulator CheB